MKGFRQRVQEQLARNSERMSPASLPEQLARNAGRRSPASLPERKNSGQTEADRTNDNYLDAISIANKEMKRVTAAQHYQFSAEERQKTLNELRERLQFARDVSAWKRTGHHDILVCLARVHEKLGEYQEAEDLYEALYPALSPDLHGFTGLSKCFSDEGHNSELMILKEYVWFLARTGRKPDMAEALIRMLSWDQPGFLKSQASRRDLLLNTIRILNDQSNYTEASKHMMVFQTLFAPHLENYSPTAGIQSAIIEMGQGSRDQAQVKFIESFVMNSVCRGLWHISTLESLYYFGKALKDWERHQEAAIILKECCLGSIHRFGNAHPFTKRALETLETCKTAQAYVKAVKGFTQASFSRVERLSVAYKHMHLNTAFDLLQGVESFRVDYAGLLGIIQDSASSKMLSVEDLNTYLTKSRAMARCIFELGDPKAAFDTLRFLDFHTLRHSALPTKPNHVNTFAVTLDRIKYMVALKKVDIALRMSKATLLVFAEEPSVVAEEEIRMMHKNLTTAGVTHFTHDLLAEDIPLIWEQRSGVLGTGAYAVVDSVKIGTKLYARKSVFLPRYNQKSIRNTIQNELSVIRTLDHPHIVQVHLTYEDKTRFFIVMRPLADCDLEAFLEEHTQRPPTQAQQDMVWRWFLCLSNTLTFIHSKGIRHKDIKPRNILVKGDEVIFADFGSSHDFLDEGNSTTEGPAFGHTKMYCAPEVIANGKRGRSADVFSLGCIFTELAVWLAGSTIADWVLNRETIIDGRTTIAYSETLDTVTSWFAAKQLDPDAHWLSRHLIPTMIQVNPEHRPSAGMVSEGVIDGSEQARGKRLEECSECSLELWLDSYEAPVVEEKLIP